MCESTSSMVVILTVPFTSDLIISREIFHPSDITIKIGWRFPRLECIELFTEGWIIGHTDGHALKGKENSYKMPLGSIKSHDIRPRQINWTAGNRGVICDANNAMSTWFLALDSFWSGEIRRIPTSKKLQKPANQPSNAQKCICGGFSIHGRTKNREIRS